MQRSGAPLGSTQIAELQQTVQSLRAINAKLTAELEQQRQENQRLQARVEKKEREAERQRESLSRSQLVEENLRTANSAYRQNDEEAQYRIGVLEKQLREQELQLSVFKAAQRAQMQEQKREYEETISQLRFVLAGQEEELQRLREARDNAVLACDGLRRDWERERVQGMLDELEADDVAVEDVVAAKRRLFAELRADLGE